MCGAFVSAFHTSHCDPSVSVNGDGSMDPPNDSWQMNGSGSGSTKGPYGSAADARPMHCTPAG